MTKIIVGNWKMNGTTASALPLARDVARFAAEQQTKHEVVLCPPFTLLGEVGKALQGSFVALGAQDCSAQAEGAFTGEVSALLLAEQGCRYVIVGHSERRQYHHETDEMVKAKAEMAMKAGLTPIICVGETEEQRKAGQAFDAVKQQLLSSLPATSHQPPTTNFLLAYEPVWAIGSGKIPSHEEIAAMHAHIASMVGATKILYGGSVKAANAQEIMAISHVAGVLVGGASLKAEEFCGIIEIST